MIANTAESVMSVVSTPAVAKLWASCWPCCVETRVYNQHTLLPSSPHLIWRGWLCNYYFKLSFSCSSFQKCFYCLGISCGHDDLIGVDVIQCLGCNVRCTGGERSQKFTHTLTTHLCHSVTPTFPPIQQAVHWQLLSQHPNMKRRKRRSWSKQI